MTPFIVWLKDADTHDTSSIGKAGKHIAKLTQAGFPILPGFIITSNAYHTFLKENKLDVKIKKLLTTVNTEHPESIYQVAKHIQDLIAQSKIPGDIAKEVEDFYKKLRTEAVSIEAHTTAKPSHKVAKSKAIDLESLMQHVKESWGQHFEPNYFWKRHEHGHDHIDTGMEVIIQLEIQPQKTGKLHTVNVHDHGKGTMTITVHHSHASDRYTLSKKNLMLIHRDLSHYGKAPKLTYEEIFSIATLGKQIENQLYFPQEITWAIDNDTVYILDSKPFSSLPKVKTESKKKLAASRGISITKTIGTGPVTIIHHDNDLDKSAEHIVVISSVAKSHVNKLKRAKGLITEKGKVQSEVSTLIKALGIPTIYGVKDATKKFKSEHVITIHAGKGEIYIGGLH